MTFSLLLVENNRPQVIGTLWADDEKEARLIATDICPLADRDELKVRRTDDREIPFRLADRPLRIV